MTSKDEKISYADAVAELEAIAVELEQPDVDVDVLADRVARAAQLITLCRDRIASTRLDVERVVAGLEETDTA
jgi:exodeoxyribonuclease VII small subunit